MNPSPPRNLALALVGYRGTGKTTVGRILAERLGRPFADADREVEARVGRSIRQIFDQDGEHAFRQHESQAITRLTTTLAEGGILATGGGAVLLEANRRALRDFGFVVWLACDPESLAERLSRSRAGVEQRPALTSAGTLAEIAEVLEARTPLYRDVAQAVVETAGRTLDQVAESVLRAWTDGGRCP